MSSIVGDVLEPEELIDGLFCEISVRKFEVSFPEAPVEDIGYQ
jgi:hypothetical protein